MTTHPKITYIIGSLEVGGAEMHLAQVAPALKQRGYDIEVICLSHKIVLREPFEAVGISIAAPNDTTLPLPTLLKRLMNLLKRTVFLMCLLSKRRERLVHFFLPEAYILGILVSFITRHKGLRIMSRRSMNDYQKRRRILGFLERRLHPHVDAILCNSQAIKAQLVADEGVPSEKITVIYNGVAAERITSPKTKRGSSASTFHMVCVANLIYYKGHQDLLQALMLIQDKLPKDWHLTLIGQDRGVKAGLLKMIENAGMDSHITFIHDCTNPAPYLEKATIGILPSHEEGFSNAILEMMAAGLPVIATNVGGNAEAVQDGVNGLIVPSKDPQAMSNAILTLAKESKLCKTMGQASQKIFHERFSLQACVEGYEAFYGKIS